MKVGAVVGYRGEKNAEKLLVGGEIVLEDNQLYFIPTHNEKKRRYKLRCEKFTDQVFERVTLPLDII